MSASFFVNGKEYLPSSTLCTAFGYSSDYIGKLAREEKILGTLVGRQWFVEVESLKTFALKVAVEKDIHKAELRLERKRERTEKSASLENGFSIQLSPLEALAKTIVVVLCGLCIGGLGWISVQEGVGFGEIAQGAKQNIVQISRVVSPTVFAKQVVESAGVLFAFTVQTKNIQSPTRSSVAEVFTMLPVFPPRTSLISLNNFSDEVHVSVDGNGQTFIEPVFKKTEAHQTRFVLKQVVINQKQ